MNVGTPSLRQQGGEISSSFTSSAGGWVDNNTSRWQHMTAASFSLSLFQENGSRADFAEEGRVAPPACELDTLHLAACLAFRHCPEFDFYFFFPSKADAAPARIYRDTWQDIRVAILKPTCSKGAETASADVGLSFLVKTRQPQTCCAFCVMVTCRSLNE